MANYFNTSPFVKTSTEVFPVQTGNNPVYFDTVLASDSTQGGLFHISNDGNYFSHWHYHFVGMFTVKPSETINDSDEITDGGEFWFRVPGVQKVLLAFTGTVTVHMTQTSWATPVNFYSAIYRSPDPADFDRVYVRCPVKKGYDTIVVVEMFYAAE